MRLYRASFPPSVNRSSLKPDGHHPLSHHESPSGSRKIRLGVDTNPITRRCLARKPDAAALLHDTTGGCARLVDPAAPRTGFLNQRVPSRPSGTDATLEVHDPDAGERAYRGLRQIG